MVDTLSQGEIDALLTALGPSEEEGGSAEASRTEVSARSSESFAQVSRVGESSRGTGSDDVSKDSSKKTKRVDRKYDFKRQTKFSREQLNTMQLIHEAFSRLIGTDLSTKLRAYAQATIVSVEQKTFEEFVQSIFNPTFITVFRSENLDGKALIDMNLNIVFTILDRLLGGNGTPIGVLRQLTDVEKQIMHKIMVGITERLREAWINVVDLAPVIELVESNPQFAQIVPPNEIVVSITIEIKIHDITGTMVLCIPYSTVEAIVHKFNAASWFAAVRKESSHTNVGAIGSQVKNVSLPIIVELGTTTVSLQDILALQPGEIIVTDQPVKNDLNLRVGNLTKFSCRPGIIGKKMSVVITQVLSPPEQEEKL